MTTDDGARPRRVLIVEDDDGFRNLTLKALRKAGYETDGVATGVDALEYVMANPGLALLLDQKLPDMTGSDIINTLNERGLRVPFIVMTGQGDERLAVEMMKLGAVDYLTKNLDFIDLLPRVFQRLFRELENKRLLGAAEANLRKSKERSRTILQTAMDGFMLVDMQGRLLEVNNTCCKMSGYSEQELLTMRIQDLLVDGAAKDKVANRIENILTEGGEAFFEERIRRKDGSVFDVEVSSQYKPFEGGWLVVFLRDITERKQKEARNLLEQMVEERTKHLRQETEARKRPQELLQKESDTILLVDDEPHVISSLTRALRNSPYQVLTAGSASEALTIMETTKIKVIMSQLQNSKSVGN
ncbi:MAG: response regulator [Syntrophales bacterium]